MKAIIALYASAIIDGRREFKNTPKRIKPHVARILIEEGLSELLGDYVIPEGEE